MWCNHASGIWTNNRRHRGCTLLHISHLPIYFQSYTAPEAPFSPLVEDPAQRSQITEAQSMHTDSISTIIRPTQAKMIVFCNYKPNLARWEAEEIKTKVLHHHHHQAFKQSNLSTNSKPTRRYAVTWLAAIIAIPNSKNMIVTNQGTPASSVHFHITS
jgi:hypothetical protein